MKQLSGLAAAVWLEATYQYMLKFGAPVTREWVIGNPAIMQWVKR